MTDRNAQHVGNEIGQRPSTNSTATTSATGRKPRPNHQRDTKANKIGTKSLVRGFRIDKGAVELSATMVPSVTREMGAREPSSASFVLPSSAGPRSPPAISRRGGRTSTSTSTAAGLRRALPSSKSQDRSEIETATVSSSCSSNGMSNSNRSNSNSNSNSGGRMPAALPRVPTPSANYFAEELLLLQRMRGRQHQQQLVDDLVRSSTVIRGGTSGGAGAGRTISEALGAREEAEWIQRRDSEIVQRLSALQRQPLPSASALGVPSAADLERLRGSRATSSALHHHLLLHDHTDGLASRLLLQRGGIGRTVTPRSLLVQSATRQQDPYRTLPPILGGNSSTLLRTNAELVSASLQSARVSAAQVDYMRAAARLAAVRGGDTSTSTLLRLRPPVVGQHPLGGLVQAADEVQHGSRRPHAALAFQSQQQQEQQNQKLILAHQIYNSQRADQRLTTPGVAPAPRQELSNSLRTQSSAPPDHASSSKKTSTDPTWKVELNKAIQFQSCGGTKSTPFPLKLHAILANEAYQGDCIYWLPDGKSFQILEPFIFEKVVIPHHFRHAKYSSFMRQINGWGFRRAVVDGDIINSRYHHELFVRDDPTKCLKMVRIGAIKNAAGDLVMVKDKTKTTKGGKVDQKEDKNDVSRTNMQKHSKKTTTSTKKRKRIIEEDGQDHRGSASSESSDTDGI